MDLCFSEFAKAIQKAIQQPNDGLSVVTLLLEWVTQLPQVVGNKEKPIDIDKSMASKLLNRKVDVPLAIKNECSTPKMVTLAEKHVETKIVPFFHHLNYENILEELGRWVSDDEIMAKKTKKRLLEYLEGEKYSKFLGFLLVYVISQPNKLVEENLQVDDVPLLEEAHFRCPGCNASLTKNGKQRVIKMYQVVNIYPSNASDFDDVFKGIQEPEQINSYDNKIVLCFSCANEYEQDPTKEKYMELLSKKNQMSNTAKTQRDIDDLKLEAGIEKVILGLTQISTGVKLEDYPLTALRLNQKILPENQLLLEEIKWKVVKYYNYIRSLFSDLDQDNRLAFKTISTDVRALYLRLEKTGMSQYEIENQISEWINIKSRAGNITAAHYVVAFFVQNCEVFSEITK